MRATIKLLVSLLLLSLLWRSASLAASAPWTIDDVSGALAQTEAPVASVARLNKSQVAAARSGRLGLAETVGKPTSPAVVPVQWDPAATGSELRGVWLTPSGTAGPRQFEWRESKACFPPVMQAARDVASGQIDITDSGKPVLRYNYKTVEPGDMLNKVAPGNLIYTRARSDYIHPL
jgi:hypothetical protein